MKIAAASIVALILGSSYLPSLAQAPDAGGDSSMSAPATPANDASPPDTTPATVPAPVSGVSSASAAPTQRNLSPEVCLAKVKEMEPMIMGLRKECESAIRSLVPDPDATEQKLPPLDKVIEDKDTENFKRYGGLSEAFLYLSDKDREKGDKLFARFRANSDTVLGADDPYVGLVGGDVGLFYFFEKDFSKAEPLFLDAIRRLETHLTAKNSNNLVSNYLCMALIRDKEGKEAEAASYSKKLVDLVIKQQETKIEAPTDTAKNDSSQ